ncbi:hypothetical protein GCM10007049_17500 [Echinicola pacifica]|uniref:Heparinase II/III-like protein n=1 Tax=Echinicola pacifica TaxID=346377 RepID=A0A918UPW0_9BACT|nr:heparinase II/III family protein [Echinicola pacifica]GGZ25478.1 hypothetical protein GCM10007049_17500 [Echinicola pacifica]
MRSLVLALACMILLAEGQESIAQGSDRPLIWVNQSDKAEILQKIENQPWAKDFYEAYKNRLDKELNQYMDSPSQFLRQMPWDWSKQVNGNIPPLKTFLDFSQENSGARSILNQYLQMGIDAGILYYLTGEEDYAQFALDILHTYVEGIHQLQPSSATGNGGWVYPDDHLREARVIGAQLPIIYDFIAGFLAQNPKAYDLGQDRMVDFSIEKAQALFLTYARLAVEHGHTGSNWSVLESFSLVHNALALEDLSLRKKYLDFYIKEGTSKQDALPDIAASYQNEGDVYPETSQYSNGVAEYSSRMILLLDHYDFRLKLGREYYKIPLSIDRWNSLRYPNGDIARFGDGHRYFEEPYEGYDMAYLLGQKEDIPKLTRKFGPLLTEAIRKGKYDRAKLGPRTSPVSVYLQPTRLLWIEETKDFPFEELSLPRTDDFPHAGLYLQRNLSSTGNPHFGLMSFVGGAQMVHGHASGMDMELYGLGEVLGVDQGRGAYRTDLHENYSRLFAAHNTVVVNGASQGEGDWVNLGINTTELIAMEPMPKENARSPYHSFSRTGFVDDRGDKAEAQQERTMALIRTSPTTGYYMDIFRSKSSLEEEYHDYLYHNIGDRLEFLNQELTLRAEPKRYKENEEADYKPNQHYRNPGWHFFEEVMSTGIYESELTARFEINQLTGYDRYMKVYIPGNVDREYTKVMAPRTFESPKPYDELPTPTLVIRQQGEAWTQPFALIFEPTEKNGLSSGIQSVEKLEAGGVFKGFKVVSKIDNKILTQYIISQGKEEEYVHTGMNFRFEGAFAVITYGERRRLQHVYIGEGRLFDCKELKLSSSDMQPMSVFVEWSDTALQVNASNNVVIGKKRND